MSTSSISQLGEGEAVSSGFPDSVLHDHRILDPHLYEYASYDLSYIPSVCLLSFFSCELRTWLYMNLPCRYCTVHVMPLLRHIPQLSILDLAGVLEGGLRFLLFSPRRFFSKAGLGDILSPCLCFLCFLFVLVTRDRPSKIGSILGFVVLVG